MPGLELRLAPMCLEVNTNRPQGGRSVPLWPVHLLLSLWPLIFNKIKLCHSLEVTCIFNPNFYSFMWFTSVYLELPMCLSVFQALGMHREENTQDCDLAWLMFHWGTQMWVKWPFPYVAANCEVQDEDHIKDLMRTPNGTQPHVGGTTSVCSVSLQLSCTWTFVFEHKYRNLKFVFI
jgi:hypothetical protein